MVTLVYSLESGQIERISSVDVESISAQVDFTVCGVLEADIEMNSDVQNRYRVVDGVLVDRGLQPNSLVLLDLRAATLSRTDWMTIRHRDQRDAGASTSLSEEQYVQLLEYKQALRDWPVSGDFNEAFPVKPAWM